MSIQRLYYQWEEAFSEKVGRDVLSGLKGLLLEDEPAKYSIVEIYVSGNALLLRSVTAVVTRSLFYLLK